jgi:hypothetical protein
MAAPTSLITPRAKVVPIASAKGTNILPQEFDLLSCKYNDKNKKNTAFDFELAQWRY